MMPKSIFHDRGYRNIDLWCFFYQSALQSGAATVAAYEALLSPPELCRYEAYIFDKDRMTFLATRVLIRTVLSHYVDRQPQSWRFETGPYGKPALADKLECGSLYFNLSNTNGLVVCGISREVERIGVDVESIPSATSLVNIAESHFAPPEIAAWRAQLHLDREETLFRYWTLKESFMKATGQGLSTPLDRLSFTLAPRPATCTENIIVEFDPRLGEQAKNWRFVQWRTHGGYVVALSADTGGQSLRCRLLRASPLRPGHGAPMEALC